MPVDQQALNAAIEESAAGDAEFAAILRERLSKNDASAVAFVGGFMRNRDYTAKTQALSADKQKYDQQLSAYQQQLADAEAAKDKVLKDLANQKVSVATATTRLQAIKDKYQLDDDDIPPAADLTATRRAGAVVDSTPDLDERLAAMEKRMEEKWARTIVPELSGMANLDIVWADMRDEHRELTGARLTAKQQHEILEEARKGNKSLVAVWEEKYQIPDARKKVEREQIVKEERAKWDAEQTARRSQEAMEGIRPGAADETGLRTSSVLKKQFAERGPIAVDPADLTKTRQGMSAVERQGLTGAERAAKKFLERRANGVPMGAPDPVKKTA